jgi:hypothetical protein
MDPVTFTKSCATPFKTTPLPPCYKCHCKSMSHPISFLSTESCLWEILFCTSTCSPTAVTTMCYNCTILGPFHACAWVTHLHKTGNGGTTPGASPPLLTLWKQQHRSFSTLVVFCRIKTIVNKLYILTFQAPN